MGNLVNEVIISDNENYKEYEKMRKRLNRELRKKIFMEKVKKCTDFVMKNKEVIMFVTPFVVSGLVAGTKFACKTFNNKQKRDLKELFFYDRSLGHYWNLKRKLTNRELISIDKRKKAGERLSDILSELKVLK